MTPEFSLNILIFKVNRNMKNKKHIIALGALLFSSVAFSQVVIGGTTGSAGTNTDAVLLDFPENQGKGIILPYVKDKSGISQEGTIILDASTPSDARVKFFNGQTGDGWVDLSGNGAINIASGDALNTATVMNAVLANQPTDAESSTSQTIIGNVANAPDGVLVLNSDTKAMVLPIVADYTDVKNPSPGMMVYIKKAGAKRLAVFNGSKWTFWKP